MIIIDVDEESFFGTTPTGSHLQSLVMEFMVSFLLMFVISGVATDNRAVRKHLNSRFITTYPHPNSKSYIHL